MRQNKARRILDEQFVKYKPYPHPTFLWPTEFKHVNQAFGINPQWYEPFGLPGHEGIDMRAPEGSKIYAVWNGIVSRHGKSNAYGHHLRIEHEIRGVFYETVYAHFIQPSPFLTGTFVKKGSVIGLADSTGNSTGSHLHFTLKQYNGNMPDTILQNRFAHEWMKFNIVDPTMFFRELRHGYK